MCARQTDCNHGNILSYAPFRCVSNIHQAHSLQLFSPSVRIQKTDMHYIFISACDHACWVRLKIGLMLYREYSRLDCSTKQNLCLL